MTIGGGRALAQRSAATGWQRKESSSAQPGAAAGTKFGVDAHGVFKVRVTAWCQPDTPDGCTSVAGPAGAGIVVDVRSS